MKTKEQSVLRSVKAKKGKLLSTLESYGIAMKDVESFEEVGDRIKINYYAKEVSYEETFTLQQSDYVNSFLSNLSINSTDGYANSLASIINNSSSAINNIGWGYENALRPNQWTTAFSNDMTNMWRF